MFLAHMQCMASLNKIAVRNLPDTNAVVVATVLVIRGEHCTFVVCNTQLGRTVAVSISVCKCGEHDLSREYGLLNWLKVEGSRFICAPPIYSSQRHHHVGLELIYYVDGISTTE